MLKCLAEKSVIIGHKSIQFTPMYVIKWLCVQPLLLIDINLECAVWRDPSQFSTGDVHERWVRDYSTIEVE